MATRQEDHDWSSLVFWVVEATIHAEENDIKQNTSIQMPEVMLFGNDYNRLLRDVILTVGNYGEIYKRNVESHMPRSGRNTLNLPPFFGPQHYVAPGLSLGVF